MGKFQDITRVKNLSDTDNFNVKMFTPDLKWRDINTQVYSQGISVDIYTLLKCPNILSIDGGEHSINCPVCNGIGYIDIDPVTTVALFQSQKGDARMNYSEMQQIAIVSDSLSTFLSGTNLIYFQKVVISNFDRLYNQNVQRQEGDLDRLHYQAVRTNACIDQNNQRYYEFVDYIVCDGGIKWISQNRPAKGIIYSLNYNCVKSFRALKALHSSRYVTEKNKQAEIKEYEVNEQWLLRESWLVENQHETNQGPEYVNKIMEKENV